MFSDWRHVGVVPGSRCAHFAQRPARGQFQARGRDDEVAYVGPGRTVAGDERFEVAHALAVGEAHGFAGRAAVGFEKRDVAGQRLVRGGGLA